MITLGQLIKITVDRQTKGVKQAGFGTALFLASNLPVGFTARIKWYTNADDVKTDTTNGSAAHEFAKLYFMANPAPTLLAIGRRGATELPDVALAEIAKVDNSWFCVCMSSRTETDVLNCAAWVEGQASSDSPKFFVSSSSDVNIGNPLFLPTSYLS